MSVDAGQMYVKKAVDQKVEVKVGHGGDSSRLTSSGMDRDRSEKFGMQDDYDFASLRSGLKSTKNNTPKTDDAKLAAARAKTGHEIGVVKNSNQISLK